MLRFISLVLSVVLAIQFDLLIAPTYADTVTVITTATSATSGLTGQAPVTKVGALIAGDALAILNGTEIKIESKSKSKPNSSAKSGPANPPNSLLNGVLMQTKLIGPGAGGYVVFNGGDRFSRINSNNCPDRVTTTTGATYTGTITSASASALSISTTSGVQAVNVSDVAEIHSARAFKYNIADCKQPKMDFTSTCQHSVEVTSKGNNFKKLVIVGLALSVVSVAIAVPVALAAGRHHSNNNINNIVAANILNSRQAVMPQVSMPMGMRTPTPQQLGQIYIFNLQKLQGSRSSLSTSVFQSASSSSNTRGVSASSGSVSATSGTSGTSNPIIVIP